MDYAECLAYLDHLAKAGVKAGLDHTRALAKALGDPQGRFPSILVAGTNGKGSVSATLATVLTCSGFKAGLYTSPHLVHVRERVRVGDADISPGRFADLLSGIRLQAEGDGGAGVSDGPPTHFEVLTLLAFLHFCADEVDVAVLEVGLGGRWDCTNIAEPSLSLVTSISRDHEEWLGAGIANIAREKAGILRAGVPALTAASDGEALRVLAEVARTLGAPLGLPSETLITARPGSWNLECPEGSVDNLPRPLLPGDHQMENAALAVRAALVLRGQGWEIPDEAIRRGLASVRWRGRLQRVGEAPAVYLDGAHNPGGCEALARFAEGLARPRVLVFAAMRDKPVAEMAAALAPAFDAVVATEVPMDRCAPASSLPLETGAWERGVEPDPAAALERARRRAGPGGSVVVAGSLFLAGHLLAALEGQGPAGQ